MDILETALIYEKIALKCNTFYCYTLRCRFAFEDLLPHTVQFKMHIPERNNMLPPQKKHKILGESNCVGREVQNVYENLPKRAAAM